LKQKVAVHLGNPGLGIHQVSFKYSNLLQFRSIKITFDNTQCNIQ